MPSLLEHFKDDIFAAIKKYRAQKKQISAHRLQDITDIENIVSAQDIEMPLEVVLPTLKTRLAQFHTGFLFFQSGHSTLRDGLNAVIRRYENMPKNPYLIEIYTQVQLVSVTPFSLNAETTPVALNDLDERFKKKGFSKKF